MVTRQKSSTSRAGWGLAAQLRGLAGSLRAIAVVAVIAAAILGLGATVAGAHASLVSSSPADGATVDAAPTRVRLVFDEDLRASSTVIIVTAPDRTRVEEGPPQVAKATATQGLGKLTAVGRYTIAYRAMSADGHPVFGQLTFTFAPPGSAVPAAASVPEQKSAGQSALAGHGAHLVALGIVIAAAAAASVIALVKDRDYDRPAGTAGSAEERPDR